MKKIFLLLILFCALSVSAQPKLDSLKVAEMHGKIEKLEEFRDQFYWILTFLGVATAGALIGIYREVKAKMKELVEKETTQKLEAAISAKLAEYPFFQSYDQEQKAKKDKKIILIGPEDKDMDFFMYLDKMGFKNIKHAYIDQDLTDLIKESHLVLFDNREGNLQQASMDAVVQKFPRQVYYFYLSSEGGPRWEGAKPEKKMGFANSLGRLEQNLIDLLK